MIVEFRTYTLNPGATPEFEKRFAEALPNRTKLSPLAAFWHTEIGPLNQVLHMWSYDSFDERARLRGLRVRRPHYQHDGGRERNRHQWKLREHRERFHRRDAA